MLLQPLNYVNSVAFIFLQGLYYCSSPSLYLSFHVILNKYLNTIIYLSYFIFLDKWFKACGQVVRISSSCNQTVGRSPIQNKPQPTYKVFLNHSKVLLPNSDLLWQTPNQNSSNNNQNLSSLIFASTKIYFYFDWCPKWERMLLYIYNSVELRGHDFLSS